MAGAQVTNAVGGEARLIREAPGDRVAAPGSKGATVEYVDHLGGPTGDGHQSGVAGSVDAGDGLQQGLCVGVTHFGEQGCRWRFFHGVTGIHDHDLVGPALDHPQVVGDEDHGHAPGPTEVVEEVEDVLLDGHVECCGRFVGDQEAGTAGQGHGDHDTLAEPAGEFVWVLIEPLCRFRDADLFEQVSGFGKGVASTPAQVDP